MKAFNTVASAVLGAVIFAASGAQAVETPVPVHHTKNQEMARFLPDWKATMDPMACSKDGRKIHAAFQVYPAVNHLEQLIQRLGDDKAAHKMVSDASYDAVKLMWQRLAARHTAAELTASVGQLRSLPAYTELMQHALEKIHRKTEVSAFAQAVEVRDRGPC